MCFCVKGTGKEGESTMKNKTKITTKINKARPFPYEADILLCCNKQIIPNARERRTKDEESVWLDGVQNA